MDHSKPYAYIVEQPAKCGVRFRYECEGRISSAIPGASSSASKFTFPTIAVAHYSGPVKVIVSCVTKNAPYRTHPHNLVGKKYCSQGICVATFAEPFCVFTNLGILCAKRKDVKERLRVREQLQIDPFGTGFSHRLHTFKLIDLNVIRLCFQVFLLDPNTGKYNIALEPIVSDEIYDKKAMSELSIAKLSHYSAPASGGLSVVMLCDRVLKEDIQIRFYRNGSNGQVVWEKLAQFSASDIHKHFAISFRVPSYELSLEGEDSVPVQVQLRRPSDGCTSDPITFYFTSENMRDNKSFDESLINSHGHQESGHSEQHYPHFDEPLNGGQNHNNQENHFAGWSDHHHQHQPQNLQLKCELDDYLTEEAYIPEHYSAHPLPPFDGQPDQHSTTAEHPLMPDSEYWNHELIGQQHQSSPMILDISQNTIRSDEPQFTAFTPLAL